MSLVAGLFFLVLLLNQRWSPPLRLQASHCSTFRIMCDFPSIAVFAGQSIECFPGTGSKFFLKLFVTIPVAPIITGIIAHFRFHIRCISIQKLLYFNFFSASFCTTFLVCGYCHIYQCVCFLLFVFNYYIWTICYNFSLCVYGLIPQHWHIIIIIIIIITSFRFLIASQVWKGFIYRTLKVAQLEVSSKVGSSAGGMHCNYATM